MKISKLPIIGKNKTAIKRIEYNAVNMAPSVIERIEFKSSPHKSHFSVALYVPFYVFIPLVSRNRFQNNKKRQQDHPAAFLYPIR